MAVFLNGDAIPAPNARGERVVDDTFLMCFNAHRRPGRIHHSAGASTPAKWTAVLDTTDANRRTDLVVKDGDEVSLQGRSLLILRKTN